jgi:exopolysaccharide biosynthesis polyprenyl glycosylphosphotransferase
MIRKQEISKDLPMIVDGLLLGACLWISHLLRTSGLIRLDRLGDIPPFSQSYWMLALIIPLSPLILDLHGYYSHPLSQRLEKLVTQLARSGFWLVLIIGTASVFGRLEVPSRSVLIIFLILAPLTLMLRVVITRALLKRNYRLGTLGERSVIIGSVKDAEAFVTGLGPLEKLELQITQRLDLDLLDTATIRRTIRQHSAGRVIFVTPQSPLNADLPISCEDEGLEVWILSPSVGGLFGIPSFETAGRSRVMVFRRLTDDFWQSSVKRLIDIVGAALGIIILLPVALIVAAGIKLTSPGPIIFRQVRSGKRGRRFTILKFRSMVANAPDLHADLTRQNEMEGPVFKISSDPRVTPFGEFLRRTSLDEIPQLLNVLRGEMSIVGPRPLPDYETEKIEKSTHRRRLSVKPGLTCLWQIRGRSSIRNFDDWVRLDIEYIDNASLLLDLWIILRTIPAVLFRKGAH